MLVDPLPLRFSNTWAKFLQAGGVTYDCRGQTGGARDVKSDGVTRSETKKGGGGGRCRIEIGLKGIPFHGG